MSNEAANPQLTVRQPVAGLLQVVLSGDWIARGQLPGVAPLEEVFTGGAGSVKALEFETANLGRWNSGLMTFEVKCYELCERNKAEFRAQTLPPGVAKLLELSRAVPEKTDAARTTERAPFFKRLGQSAIAGWGGAIGMLTFVGENVLACVKLLRHQAQFRWADAILVMEEFGPRALGRLSPRSWAR